MAFQHIGPLATSIVENAYGRAVERLHREASESLAEYDRTGHRRHLARYEAKAEAAQKLLSQATDLDEVRHG